MSRRSIRNALCVSGCAFIAVVLLLLLDFDTKETIVAVLDTGVNPQHELLQDKVLPGYDFIDFTAHAGDENGHGTHVAGIIAKVSPKAKIIPIKVINEQDQVKNTSLGIMYAIWHGADIINMSFADSFSVWTWLAIQYGSIKDVQFVASAGNAGIEDAYYPAKYKPVYSISGWDQERDDIFGNYGKEVQYVTPGRDIESAGLDGGYTLKSGTSMSAAFFSGILGVLKEATPDLGVDDLNTILQRISVDVKGKVQATKAVAAKTNANQPLEADNTSLSKVTRPVYHYRGIDAASLGSELK